MRLVYFGTAEFAVPALQRLAQSVVLVVSQPDRPSGRGMRLSPSPVKQAALQLGLPVETPSRARNPEFVELLRGLDADALIVAAYGQILSVPVLESARRGGINLHGSILPKYRGAAPIQRAILEGETETGVTLMQMDKGMDTGDMIDVIRTPIGPDETYGELQQRLASLAADLVGSWAERIVAGDYPRTRQSEAEATHAAKVAKHEAELDFTKTASEAYRRFRAFTPSPGAFIRTSRGVARIRSARLGVSEGQPGTLSGIDEVAFAEGSLKLLELQPDGRKAMSMRDYANGLRLRTGDPL